MTWVELGIHLGASRVCAASRARTPGLTPGRVHACPANEPHYSVTGATADSLPEHPGGATPAASADGLKAVAGRGRFRFAVTAQALVAIHPVPGEDRGGE